VKIVGGVARYIAEHVLRMTGITIFVMIVVGRDCSVIQKRSAPMIESMKAITLWQPWASLLTCGAKIYETRSWATNYRGPIAIHAGLKDPYITLRGECLTIVYPIFEALGLSKANKKSELRSLPRGAVIATAELMGCWRITANDGKRACMLHLPNGNPCVSGNELLFGDWTPGRYAWEFANMVILPEPILVRGRQGLWNWAGVA